MSISIFFARRRAMHSFLLPIVAFFVIIFAAACTRPTDLPDNEIDKQLYFFHGYMGGVPSLSGRLQNYAPHIIYGSKTHFGKYISSVVTDSWYHIVIQDGSKGTVLKDSLSHKLSITIPLAALKADTLYATNSGNAASASLMPKVLHNTVYIRYNHDGTTKSSTINNYSLYEDGTPFKIIINQVKKYAGNKVPVAEGHLKGYLYNTKNRMDSILIDGDFRTRAY